MPTNRKRRTRQIVKKTLSDSWKYFLETGDYCSAIDKDKFPDVSNQDRFYIFQLGNPSPGGGYWEKLRKIWMQHKEEILRIWKSEKRQGKPWAGRIFDNE